MWLFFVVRHVECHGKDPTEGCAGRMDGQRSSICRATRVFKGYQLGYTWVGVPFFAGHFFGHGGSTSKAPNQNEGYKCVWCGELAMCSGGAKDQGIQSATARRVERVVRTYKGSSERGASCRIYSTPARSAHSSVRLSEQSELVPGQVFQSTSKSPQGKVVRSRIGASVVYPHSRGLEVSRTDVFNILNT